MPGPPPPPGAEGEIILSDEETTAQRGKAGCPYGGPRQGLNTVLPAQEPTFSTGSEGLWLRARLFRLPASHLDSTTF